MKVNLEKRRRREVEEVGGDEHRKKVRAAGIVVRRFA